MRLATLPQSVVTLLGGLKAKQKEERRSLGIELDETGYVFCLPDGHPYNPDSVSLDFANLTKLAGLPHLRLHDLRHSHATIMMEQGVNPKTVAERLRHSSVVITLDTYSHVLPNIQEEAAVKFEEAMNRSAQQR
ncbi:MAG: tyrosine-type recombinase/integrase [Chloroflexi bacterium]|nr:tyrosine-type recombinase/integrase [Chloroflexota bacterium]